MPAGKPSQSNASLYTALTFVALFLIAATAAIIFYMKYEDQRILKDEAINARNEVVTIREYGKLKETIGKPLAGKSYTATLLDYYDTMNMVVTGQISESSAAMKLEGAKRQINKLIEDLGPDASAIFVKDGINLIYTITDLKNKLEQQRKYVTQLKNSLGSIQDNYDTVVSAAMETEKALNADVSKYQTKTDKIQASYKQLELDMEKSTDDQVKIYKGRLEEKEMALEQTSIELETTKATLAETTDQLNNTLAQLEAIKPQPDREVAAFTPDAKVTSVDLQTDLIYLDIGSEAHVYTGLTFVIFDKSNPRPKNGIGKAEIEVFQVGKKVSAARVISSDTNNPISQDDLAVNLIWNSKTSNKFVVTGEFDYDGNGKIDKDGREKIIQLIERWGGIVTDNVTIATDFVVLGHAPTVPQKPTFKQIEYDPTIEQKYEKALTGNETYTKILIAAEKLDTPKFNRQRFFNLIGYDKTAAKSSPF